MHSLSDAQFAYVDLSTAANWLLLTDDEQQQLVRLGHDEPHIVDDWDDIDGEYEGVCSGHIPSGWEWFDTTSSD